MKRQVIALAIGSLFALPALANQEPTNAEMFAGYATLAQTSGKSASQVRQELLAAEQSGDWKVNPTLGTVSRPAAPTATVGKTRAEVRAELEQAYRSGEMIANAELGTPISHM